MTRPQPVKVFVGMLTARTFSSWIQKTCSCIIVAPRSLNAMGPVSVWMTVIV